MLCWEEGLLSPLTSGKAKRAAWGRWPLPGVSLLEREEVRDPRAQPGGGCVELGWETGWLGAPHRHPSSMLCTPRHIRSGCVSTALSTRCTGSSIRTTSSSSSPLPRWAGWGPVGWGQLPACLPRAAPQRQCPPPQPRAVMGNEDLVCGRSSYTGWSVDSWPHIPTAPLPASGPRTGASSGGRSPSTCRC